MNKAHEIRLSILPLLVVQLYPVVLMAADDYLTTLACIVLGGTLGGDLHCLLWPEGEVDLWPEGEMDLSLEGEIPQIPEYWI